VYVTQEEAAALVAALLRSDLRPESVFALLTAAHAIQTEGISGTLVVKVPRKAGAPTDVNFTTGSTHVALDFP
jgi:hypothetical protein